MTAIAIIPPTSSVSCFVSLSGIAVSRIARSRNGETTPSAEEKTISPSTAESFRQYGRNRRETRRRFALRTAGSAGRSGFSAVMKLRKPGMLTAYVSPPIPRPGRPGPSA